MNKIDPYPDVVLTCEQMGACDRWTIAQGFASGIELMENAGAAIAATTMEKFADASSVHVLCGPGNNGGDGYVVARLMAERGANVRLYALGDPKSGTDAAIAAERWNGDVLQFNDFKPGSDQALLIDAVFGAGFKGKLPETVAAALERAKAAGMRKLAVDVPSGLSGDTGLSEIDLTYDATVTFFRKKPGHICGQGPDICGELIVSDIGVRADFAGAHKPTIFENRPTLWRDHRMERQRSTHKYRQGHVAVFSGPKHKTGAARLSALAAARAGAGAVTLLGSEDASDVHANHVTSIMLKRCDKDQARQSLADLNKPSAVILGPGFDDFAEARSITHICLSPDHDINLPLVLDADGISAFADHSEELFALARKSEDIRLVLTPHEGEFGRLFPDLAADTSLAKWQKAKAAAHRARAIIVYKGADTIIASPSTDQNDDGVAAINTNATAALATAGSGDVLAGIIAGLIAQGMPLSSAACVGVWMHGEAGKLAGPVCIAEDLVEAIRSLHQLR